MKRCVRYSKDLVTVCSFCQEQPLCWWEEEAGAEPSTPSSPMPLMPKSPSGYCNADIKCSLQWQWHLLLVRACSETEDTDSFDLQSLDKAVASCLSDLP